MSRTRSPAGGVAAWAIAVGGAAARSAVGRATGTPAAGAGSSSSGTALDGRADDALAAAVRRYLLRRGSSASRRPSERKFTEMANAKRTAPGQKICHQGK